ncbi:MAG: redoxin domain-containing protein [Planctomycetes bacterium]|nr:redoxin domain-containing protein [Planctomycetota bacterium]
MKSFLLVAASLLFAAAPALAQKSTLHVGDAAPAIQVKQWVKGEPVTAFAKDKLYVVEFWATWCPPCRKSIPHLTELQKKFKDVSFIGVSVFEHETDQSKVAPFVETMGDKMDYRVAMDDVPEGKKNNDGAMAKNWMIASGSSGIPTAFIVDKTGHIAWIGHPMEMEESLAKVVAGTWDLAAYEKEKAAADALDAARNELGQKLNQLMKDEDTKGAIAAIDEAVAKIPALEKDFGVYRFKFMLDQKDYAAASTYGAKLADGVLKDEASGLNFIAWTILDPDQAYETRDLKLALRTATRANELSKGEEPNILDTLARACFSSGDAAKAIEYQTKACELVKGTRSEKEFKSHLEEYKTGKPAGN